ncbi:hypothetical protein T484DRAFT_1832766 [Baffinella frigidus]|nr:hypothetical protein T484DRAFT_1832766 [Cryptophyta sp. CCMP2293]
MVIFNADCSRVVTSSAFGKAKKGDWNARLKVWDAASGGLVGVLSEHTQPVYVLDTHPRDRRVIVSAGYYAKVRFWDIQTCGYDAKVCFWDIQTCSVLKVVTISFATDLRLLPVV